MGTTREAKEGLAISIQYVASGLQDIPYTFFDIKIYLPLKEVKPKNFKMGRLYRAMEGRAIYTQYVASRSRGIPRLL